MHLHKILNQPIPCFTSLPADTALDQAVSAMAHTGKTAVMVVDDGQVKGIVTRTDILGLLEKEASSPLGKKTVSQLMSRDLVLADPDASLEDALDRMAEFRIEHLPVIQDGRLLTVLHESHLLRQRIEVLRNDIGVLQEYIDHLHNASQD